MRKSMTAMLVVLLCFCTCVFAACKTSAEVQYIFGGMGGVVNRPGAGGDSDSDGDEPPVQTWNATESLTYIKHPDGSGQLVSGLEEGATDTDIVIAATVDGESIVGIAKNAFYGNSKIKSVRIQDGVKTIGEKAFKMCPNLVTVTLPDTLEYVDTTAFPTGRTEQSRLKATIANGIAYLGSATNPYLFAAAISSTGNASYTLHADVKILEQSLFANCNAVSAIEIPAGVLYIPSGCFSNTYSLQTVTLPDGVRSIEAYAFNGSGLESIVIPASVQKIEGHAFVNCFNLAKVYYGGSWRDDLIIRGTATDNELQYILDAAKYNYSESGKVGNYWHWSNDGKTPIEW